MRGNGRFFSAVLKTEDDQFLERGRARVQPEDRSVEFRSDFVPLMKFGTPAKIVRILNEIETHSFMGTVYLSSKNYLRLVNVTDEMLTDQELGLSIMTEIPAKLTPMLSSSEMFHLPLRGLIRFDAEIYSISLTSIKFSCTEEFLIGDRLMVQTEEPVELNKAVVEVYQIVAFDTACSCYRCNIVSLPEPCASALSAYLARENQIFPDDDDEGEST